MTPVPAAQLTPSQFAKHLDMARHQPWLTGEEIVAAATLARESGVAAFYTNTCWTRTVADVLVGSDIRIGAAVGFPLGNSVSDVKLAEVAAALRDGATAVDMVVNIGAWRAGDVELVRREIVEWVARCSGRALTKLIFEVPYFSHDKIAALTDLCCELGVDYVKTSTGPETGPDEEHVQIMVDRTAGTATRVKVSGVPRPYTLAACLWMIDQGVDLIGTGKAPELVAGLRDRQAPPRAVAS